MTQQITNWLKYCDGDESFEMSHFIALLISHRSDQELRQIFQHVSAQYRDAIISNLCEVFSASNPDSVPYLHCRLENLKTGDELAPTLELFFASLKTHLLTVDIWEGTAKWLQEAKLETVVVRRQDVDSHIDGEEDWKCQLIQEEGDWMNFVDDWGLPMEEDDDQGFRVMSGIREGLYGLATDFQLGWFVLMPILKGTVDYRLYFDFWRQGGLYEITDSQLVISSIGH